MSLQEELGSSRKALGLVFLCTLMVVYGGMTIPYGEGTWFHEEFEFVSSSTSTSNESGNGEFKTEGVTSYKIDEVEREVEVTLNGNKDSDDDSLEYDDDGFEDREDVMKRTKNLALLSILLAGGLLTIIMGLYTGQFENPKEYLNLSKNLCLGLTLVCLFNAIHFALNYPDAWQDDTSNSLIEDCGIDPNNELPFLATFLGECTNENTAKAFPGYTGDYVGKWHPGPAWFITFALIPSITALEYRRLMRIEENGVLAEYEHAQVRKQRQRIADARVVPVVPEPETIVPPEFKRKEPEVKSVKCPDCGNLIDVEVTGKPQDIECSKCGLKGEMV